MENMSYTDAVKAWELAEQNARQSEKPALSQARVQAEQDKMPQGSAAQANLLRFITTAMKATSVIVVGNGSVVETLQLVDALGDDGLLTAVDSSAHGISLIRQQFTILADEDQIKTTLRAVNASPEDFLPRLNADSYDLIAVCGEVENYEPTFNQAPRLLKQHGIIAFTDMGGTAVNDSGKAAKMRELLSVVQDDDRFDSALTPTGTGLLLALKR
jgi:predicted O-methyltransferase YrrM